MRLIDADKLPRRRYPEYDETGEFIDVMCVRAEDIDNAPTVDAIVPLVKGGQTVYRVGDPIKKIIVIFIIAVGLVGSISNEMNEISAGVIVDREVNTGIGGTAYYFTIEDRLNGKMVQYRFEVSSSEYDKYQTGDFYER